MTLNQKSELAPGYSFNQHEPCCLLSLSSPSTFLLTCPLPLGPRGRTCDSLAVWQLGTSSECGMHPGDLGLGGCLGSEELRSQYQPNGHGPQSSPHLGWGDGTGMLA